uniref:Testis expressed 56, pseudo n=1 Tax=Canis lupus familiaris TaxID=9615 RepID=A0A8P0PDL6_CANLF
MEKDQQQVRPSPGSAWPCPAPPTALPGRCAHLGGPGAAGLRGPAPGWERPGLPLPSRGAGPPVSARGPRKAGPAISDGLASPGLKSGRARGSSSGHCDPRQGRVPGPPARAVRGAPAPAPPPMPGAPSPLPRRVPAGPAARPPSTLELPLLGKPGTPKSYAQPEVLRRTFETLSSLHRLLPSRLVDTLHSYKTEDKQDCQNPEFSGLERILARHQLPKEINATPKPSSIPLWRRKSINNANRGWKKCHLWKKKMEEPPMSTIVVRWLKKYMQPTEDLQSVIQRLSVFGPIKSVTLCGRQSAIVVFEDMISACNAVNAFQSRAPGTMFQCSWQQRFMSKDKVYSRRYTEKSGHTEKSQPKACKWEIERKHQP